MEVSAPGQSLAHLHLAEHSYHASAGTQQWQIGGSGAALDATQREALRLEIARLQNATAHLESSNTQLQQALRADPSDTDYKQALGVRHSGRYTFLKQCRRQLTSNTQLQQTLAARLY